MGSPVCENSSNLVVLDSRNIAGGGAARLRIHPHCSGVPIMIDLCDF